MESKKMIDEMLTELKKIKTDLDRVGELHDVYMLLSGSLSDIDIARDIIEEKKALVDYSEEKFGLCNL